MKKSPVFSLAGVAFVFLIMLLSCQGLNAPGTSLVTITIGAHQTATLEIRESTLWLQLKRSIGRLLTTRTAAAQVPSIVTDVRVTVSAADMQSIIRTEHVAGFNTVSMEIEVPNGTNRHFLVEGLTGSGATAYQGLTRADLNGVPVSLTVVLTPVTPGDTTPPTFAGLQSVSVLSPSSMQLNWTAATDNASSPAAIIYYIYQSATPGGEVYATPTYMTPAGALNYTVTGLAPGTDYYFVVRARDVAGNIDANTVERSGKTSGLFVNAVTGNDTTGTGSSALPFKTITKALAVTTGNDGIFVSQGTYSTGGGETFPLQLKTGTSLVCTGAGFSTIIDNSAGPDSTIILGATGALVDGCSLTTFAGGSSNPAIDDGGSVITVQNCSIVDGDPIDMSSTGIQLSANSTVQGTTITGFFGDGVGAAIRTSLGAFISGNTLNGAGRTILVSDGTPTISLNSVTNSYSGVYTVGGAPVVTGNTITASSYAGVNILGGTPVINGNTITASNNAGVYISAGTPVINGNTITACNNYGIYSSSTDTAGPIISGNFILNNTNGNNNSSGIRVTAGTPTITGNLIHHNDNGIYVVGGAPSIHNNSIYCNNQTLGLYNYGDVYYTIFTLTGFMTNNAWDHDGSTGTPGPTIGYASTNGCTSAGRDICILSTPPTANYIPFNTAVSGGCP